MFGFHDGGNGCGVSMPQDLKGSHCAKWSTRLGHGSVIFQGRRPVDVSPRTILSCSLGVTVGLPATYKPAPPMSTMRASTHRIAMVSPLQCAFKQDASQAYRLGSQRGKHFPA